MRLAALVVVILASLPSTRAEACSGPRVNLFDQVDRAEVVAVGRVVSGGVAIHDRLLGPAHRRTVRIRSSRSTCQPRMMRGHRVLVLVGADHWLVAGERSYLRHPDPTVVDALRRYIDAPDDDARRALLVELATGAHVTTIDAIHHLADRPDLVGSLTATERRRLIDRIQLAHWRVLPTLAALVARLHDPTAIAPLLARLDDVGYVDWIGIPLEVMTGHRQPMTVDDETAGGRWHRWRMRLDNRTFGSTIVGDPPPPAPTEQVRTHWTAWARAHRGDTEVALWRAAFEERHLPVVDRDDRAALARTIRTGSDPLIRAIALERCERLAGRRLERFHSYYDGVAPRAWPRLAEACERGAPVSP